MRPIPILLLLLCVTFAPGARLACAWSDAGHKLAASIAFRRLTAAERQRIVEILKEHPLFAEEFERKLDPVAAGGTADDRAEWMFQQAAVWPDMARGYRDEQGAKYHRATWHYINSPRFLTDADRAALEGKIRPHVALDIPDKAGDFMNIVQTIGYSRRQLLDRMTPADEQAVLLCWLFHAVGDLHQPMHSTAMFSRSLFPEGDRGGNLVLTKQIGNLHAVWDQGVGNTAKFREVHNRAIEITSDRMLARTGTQAAAKLDQETWLNESRELAAEMVYDAEVLTVLRQQEVEQPAKVIPIDLSEDYLRRRGEVSVRRVTQAGYRLGAILKEIARK